MMFRKWKNIYIKLIIKIISYKGLQIKVPYSSLYIVRQKAGQKLTSYKKQKGDVFMKIFVRYGHSVRFPGSSGYLDEVTVIRQYAPWVAQVLYQAGHQVMTYNPDTDPTVYPSSSDELKAGINKANEWGADLFVSCHANATELHNASGTWVLTLANDTYANTIGTNVSSQVASLLGIANKGLSHPTDKGELNQTNMSTIIIEPFFVDYKSDCDKYTAVGGQSLDTKIANAILAKI